MKYKFLRYCHSDSFGNLQMTFKPLLYFPVNTNEINSITLKIVDRNFKEILFKEGSVTTILKLKPLY